MPVPSQERPNLRPLWRFRHPLNKQKVARRDGPIKEDVIFDVQSHYVYENKQNDAILSQQYSDIYVEVRLILHKLACFEGQHAAKMSLAGRIRAEIQGDEHHSPAIEESSDGAIA
jgi:hypothetical protein